MEAFVAEGWPNKDSRLILTATVSAQRDVIERSYNIPEISKYVDNVIHITAIMSELQKKLFFNRYLDLINVKTFDFHTFDNGIVRHHSPLYSGIHYEEHIYSNAVRRLTKCTLMLDLDFFACNHTKISFLTVGFCPTTLESSRSSC